MTDLLTLVRTFRRSVRPPNIIDAWAKLLIGVDRAGLRGVEDAMDRAPDDVARGLLKDAVAEVAALDRTARELEGER